MSLSPLLFRCSMPESDEWVEWHQQYDHDGPLGRRLRAVQDLIRASLDQTPPGPIRVISMCSGDGRDLIGVLGTHPRARDVRARLVELTPELAERGRKAAADAGLTGVEFRVGDAGNTSVYAGAVPAELVLVCGVFGNISGGDIRNTIARVPELCACRATVVWTRSRLAPDITPSIRQWFADAGFLERSFWTSPDRMMSVGAHELRRAPDCYGSDHRLFTFLPKEERRSTLAGKPEPSAASQRARTRP